MIQFLLAILLVFTWLVIVPFVILVIIGYFAGKKYPGNFDRKEKKEKEK